MTSAEDMTSAAEELLAEDEKDTAAAAVTKAAKRRSKKARQRAAAAERVRAEAEAEAAAKEEALLADAADEDALAVSRREQAALEQLLIESRWQLLELQEQEQALLARLAKRAEELASPTRCVGTLSPRAYSCLRRHAFLRRSALTSPTGLFCATQCSLRSVPPFATASPG